jgi:hypothetical protein
LAAIACLCAVLGIFWNPSGIAHTIALVLLSVAVLVHVNGK